MNQLFGCCVNALITDYEIRRNGPSVTDAVLQSTSPSNPPARPPVMGGRVRGWLVCRCSQIS